MKGPTFKVSHVFSQILAEVDYILYEHYNGIEISGSGKGLHKHQNYSLSNISVCFLYGLYYIYNMKKIYLSDKYTKKIILKHKYLIFHKGIHTMVKVYIFIH